MIIINASVSYYSAMGNRGTNEDFVKTEENEQYLLALVADGLGGMGGGDIASETAVVSFLGSFDAVNASESEMNKAFARANTDVRQRIDGEGMCATLSALYVSGDRALIGYVGDTRIYQIRDGEIIYQSIDHSVSQLAVMVGEITPDEIRTHKDRNKLIRSVGADETVKPQITALSAESGDAFLLCSDGFWEKIVEEDIIRLLKSSESAEEWLSGMRAHIENSVDDNNSAIAVILK